MIREYKKEIALITLFKVVIIFLLPLTGDEAYFIKWANHLDIGYYDHPPMVGWLVYLMSFVSDSYHFFRLFSLVTVFIVSYFIYKILKEFELSEQDAQFGALVFLLLPSDILLSIFTNDIPLLLFTTLGVYFLLIAQKRDWVLNSLLSGVFFGLSFLSKYFVVFVIFGLMIYLFKEYKTKAIKKLLLSALVFMLFVAENLYYNYNSCWNNILFNFFARTQNSHYQISTIFRYLLFLLYIMTPWGIYYLVKSKNNIKNKNLLSFVISILSIALIVYLFVSLKNKIGLHWLLLLLPYLYMIFVFLKDEYKKRFLKYSLYFTYLHIVLLITLLLLPVTMFKDHKRYTSILLFTDTNKICKELNEYDKIYTTGYTSASVLSYHCKKDIKMILNNSKYGRLDDKLVDIKDLTSKKIAIFFKSKPDINELKELFKSVKVKSFEVLGGKFYIALCEGLNYKEYKKRYLDLQKKKFYNIPEWLPVGKCYFLDRYYR